MESKELRIGNYAIGIDDLLNRVCIIGIPEIEHSELFKSITLNNQWLLDFGLNKRKNYRKQQNGISTLSWFKCNTEILRLGRLEEGDFVFIFKHDNFSIQIEFVHQFQNLYFALFNEELTFNKL